MDRTDADDLNRFVTGVERRLRRLVARMPPLLRRALARAVKPALRPRNVPSPVEHTIIIPPRQARPSMEIAHQPAAPAFDARAGALELLCAAGTLSACATHSVHYLASGDLVAAHRLATDRLAAADDFQDAQDIQATAAAIDSVFEEISRFYHRCEDCHRARIERVVGA